MQNSLDTQGGDILSQSPSGAISYDGITARPWSENGLEPHDISKQNTLKLAHAFYEKASLPEILEHLYFKADEVIPSLYELSKGFTLGITNHFTDLILAKNPEIAKRYANLSIASSANNVYGIGSNPLIKYSESGRAFISYFSEEGKSYQNGFLASDDRSFYTDTYNFDLKTGDMEYRYTHKETQENYNNGGVFLDRAPPTSSEIQAVIKRQSQDTLNQKEQI